MGNLANISAKKAAKAFGKLGYSLDHQTGSHMILIHESRATLSVPNHKELRPAFYAGLLAKLDFPSKNF